MTRSLETSSPTLTCCELARTREIEQGPEGTKTSAAELFYLHHHRSCASSAAGAQSGSPGGSTPGPRAAPWLPQPGPWGDACLDMAFHCCEFAFSGFVFCLRPDVWLPMGLGSLLHSALGGQTSAVQLAALVSCNPVPWVAARSLLLGDFRSPLGVAVLGAIAADFHVRPWMCKLFSAFVVAAGCPAWDYTAGLLVAAALAWPAFPGDEPEPQPPPPPQPHPAHRPPTGRDVVVTTWAVDVLTSRRACLCRAAGCGERFEKGELRTFSPHQVNKLYYHPRCVEGGLGPFDQLGGTDVLTTEQADTIREYCDQPGSTTRAQYVEDTRRAKRARADPEQHLQEAALGAPLLDTDDGRPANQRGP